MINDSLSYASIVVTILVLILVFGSIFYSHITMKKNMRILARNSILMDADDEMKALCKQIIAIDPNSCPLMDGDAAHLVKGDPDRLKAILRAHLDKLKKQKAMA